MNRRAFLQISSRLAILLGLSPSAIPTLAEGLTQLAKGRAPVLWLQGQSCSGCSVSLLNSFPLTVDQLLTQYLALIFHQTLSSATGSQALQTVEQAIKQGGYTLVVEGAVPAAMPQACRFGEETFVQLLTRAASRAKAVLAVGTCAAFGGIVAAENNPTGALSIPDFLAQAGIRIPVIAIPGCPPHPDWLVGTILHTLKFGIPALDEQKRPAIFFARSIHDQCPRFADYERESFAKSFGDEGCLFKLGCVGALTRGDCTLRQWNSGTNMCIKARVPCIGCAGHQFAKKASFPFFTKSPRPEPTPML